MKILFKTVLIIICMTATANIQAASGCPLGGGGGGHGYGGGYGGGGGNGIWKKAPRKKRNTQASFQSITISKLVSEMKKDNVVLIDARSATQYKQKHIASASTYNKSALPGNKNKTIVVYAGNKQSKELQSTAQKIAKLKYKNVLVYKGGINEWVRRGGPTVAGTAKGEFGAKK